MLVTFGILKLPCIDCATAYLSVNHHFGLCTWCVMLLKQRRAWTAKTASFCSDNHVKQRALAASCAKRTFHAFWKDKASSCQISTLKVVSCTHVFIPPPHLSDDAKFFSGCLLIQVHCGFTGCWCLGMWCVNANPEIYIVNSPCW